MYALLKYNKINLHNFNIRHEIGMKNDMDTSSQQPPE